MGKITEKCGIVGVFTPDFVNQLPLALTAASGVQHRGMQGAGIVFKPKTGIVKHTDKGLLQDVFTPKIIKKLTQKSKWTLVHCRYGTSGDYASENLQPITIGKTNDTLAIIHNGEFAGVEKLKKRLGGKLPVGASDTYLFAKLLSQTPGVSWDEKIISACAQMYGAFSLIMGVGESLYAIRDPWGIRPLAIGQLPGGGWLVASETHAFDKVHVRVKREINKGEILKIDNRGLTRLKKGTSGKGNFCDFEWAYFSRPNSLFPTYQTADEGTRPDKWLSVTEFRERCGVTLAREHPIKKATFVVGVPDSGIHIAIGFARTLGLSYRQVIIRDHFDRNGNQRLFMKDDDLTRIKSKVLGKISFVPDPRIWKNAIVVLGDDSIVRGNVAQQVTKAVFAQGAKEVHWIVGFPPVMHPCHLGVSMRTQAELIAPQFASNPVSIARAIGATSVNYISPKGFLQAKFGNKKLLHPKDERDLFLFNGGCGGCLTGRYPVAKDGTVYKH
ncbi:MAG: Amidophosphoribosyltransferase [Candidatus Gottesmanbacteria bacterium GW2011_GWB1_43_11]|uniref:Amidophosphoribosyltransferase n=1 Tax=Candidatus Gottesmanbacteria bacterium GW2011_GWB1_43_11 TaxID=1618446 RepID=A0A0G1CLH3_9BACT|nr:MAG: Amidophosphoribosyltransferase [Candidatus Gottesmanbacteria bacterium GW2011_GWA2_42_16]KKS86354.1 MAG: Amidophosphoribosyltransferase [Candidatus Gottesmanbacteria bacterium GW2011_GWB1_43_11]